MKEPLQLGVCEFYNPYLHGPCEPPVSDYFFYTCQVHVTDLYDNSVFEYLSEYPGTLEYAGNVRAYWDITSRPGMYPMLEIVQPIVLEPGGECVAVIKTFWLRLLQRKWKRIFAERRRRLSQLLQPYGLIKRECGFKL
jgi:hypothetical protein